MIKTEILLMLTNCLHIFTLKWALDQSWWKVSCMHFWDSTAHSELKMSSFHINIQHHTFKLYMIYIHDKQTIRDKWNSYDVLPRPEWRLRRWICLCKHNSIIPCWRSWVMSKKQIAARNGMASSKKILYWKKTHSKVYSHIIIITFFSFHTNTITRCKCYCY